MVWLMYVLAVRRRKAVPTPMGRIVLFGLSLAASVDVGMASRSSLGRLPCAIMWRLAVRFFYVVGVSV